MKKKISLLLCMLTAVLTFTGCASKVTTVEYDQATLEQVVDFMIQYCSEADEATIEQWKDMREFTFEQQLADSGLPLTTDSFLSALESWQAGEDECGQFIEHGDYTFEADKDGVLVTTEAKFENREATLEFQFDEKLFLESVTVSAHFSLGEILQKAGMNTLLGMGTVFSVLIFISLIISLFKYIPAIQAAFTKKPKEAKETEKAPEAAPEAVAAPAPKAQDDAELIAVIAAAIAAAEGTSTDGFVVRSIKRRKSNKWN